jgi:glycosyltransferase involved in cell wall biosynthesis
MKVDLVMWTKNGEVCLPKVLQRIEEVVPKGNVCCKIIIDDHSEDGTVEIAERFGWKVYPNPSSGISSGANEALRHVDTEFFASFEQDLLLAFDWWKKIPHYMENPKVAAASGMRFASQPKGIAKLQQYVAKKYRGESTLSPWLRSREMSAFTLGKTLDNTIYRTSVLRFIGGFPKMQTNAGVDTVLAYKIQDAGYLWVVDYNVQSVHLRKGLMDELRHQYFYGAQLREIWRQIEKQSTAKPPVNRFSVLSRLIWLIYSPLTGLFVAFKTKEPSIAYIHPLVRFYYAKGLLKGL